MATRPPRKYAAYYRKRGKRKWKRRDPEVQGSKDSIIRLYQSWLIIFAFDETVEVAIRPVPRKKV